MPPRLPWQLPSAFQQRGALTTPVTALGGPILSQQVFPVVSLTLRRTLLPVKPEYVTTKNIDTHKQASERTNKENL